MIWPSFDLPYNRLCDFVMKSNIMVSMHYFGQHTKFRFLTHIRKGLCLNAAPDVAGDARGLKFCQSLHLYP